MPIESTPRGAHSRTGAAAAVRGARALLCGGLGQTGPATDTLLLTPTAAASPQQQQQQQQQARVQVATAAAAAATAPSAEVALLSPVLVQVGSEASARVSEPRVLLHAACVAGSAMLLVHGGLSERGELTGQLWALDLAALNAGT